MQWKIKGKIVGPIIHCSPGTVKEIGDNAFSWCESLSNLTIEEGVEHIGEAAFFRCNNLKEVICYAEDVPTTGYGAFRKVASATLMVPAASVGKYKAADQWKEFGTIVGIDTDGITAPVMDNDADARIFDLHGNRLTQPHKGVNIINGRKVLVK